MSEVECVLAIRNQFGESPVWNAAERALYWVDVAGPAVYRLRPPSTEVERWPVPESIGSIALRTGGGLIAAMRTGIYGIDLATGERAAIARLDHSDPNVRFNDGKCDRAGRFWSGTMDDMTFAPVGVLYRLDADGSCTRMDEGFIIVNGIAWSPDNTTLYVADSRREIVYRYDYCLESGSIANRRPFVSTEDVPGRVDGATVAADGTYWCAHVRGGQIAQYDPDGRLIQAIKLPTKYPLMCTFGGVDLDVLYVTTSRALVAEGETEPLAGALFAIHGTGCVGIPEPRYAG